MHIKKNFSVWLLILVPLTVALAQSEDKGPIIWKAVSVYPKDIPVFHNGIEKFAEELKSISKGQLIIEVFGAGEFKYKDKNIGPNDVFEAVSGGKVEIGYGAPTYWSDNAPGCDFMFAVPFGLNAQGMYEWLYRGEGLELMTEFFGKQNLIPFPIGNTGGAMAGWFDKEIMSVEDFKGMKIRMLGITQKVYERLGAQVGWTVLPEALNYYKKGYINAIVCQGPFLDQWFGLHRGGPKYYYYPGWQEPGRVLAIIINKEKWNALPPHLQQVIQVVAKSTYPYIFNQFVSTDSAALKDMLEMGEVILKEFSPDILNRLKQESEKVMEEEAKSNHDFKRAYDTFKKFKKEYINNEWYNILNKAVIYEHSEEEARTSELANKFKGLAKAEHKQISTIGNTVTISFEPEIFFDSRSKEPKTPLANEIDSIVKTIKEYDSIKSIRVVDHTYYYQTKKYRNLKLSLKRAEAIKKLLIDKGVKPSIKVVPLGDSAGYKNIKNKIEIIIEF